MLLSRSNCDDQYLNRNYIQSSSTQRLMPTNEHYPFPTSSWDANSSQRPTAHGDVYPFYPRPSAAGVTEAPSRQGIPTQQGGYYSYGVPGTAMSHDAGINASPQLGHAQHPSQTAATSLSRAPSRTGSAAGSSILQHISNSTEASPVLTRGVTALPINECVDPVTDPTVNEDEGDSDGSEMISESGQRLVSGQSDSTLSRKKMKRFRLTHSQSRFLTAEFAKQPHPDAAHREYLSTKIPGLSPRQVQVWFQNRRAKMKRHTQSDRDRILQMRAVPEGFDTVQALQSPYGAVSQPMASSRTPTFPTHHHPQIRTPLVELQPGSPMMLNELSAQGFRSDTMQYAADGTVHSPIAGDQGLHPLRTRRDDRSTISSPSYFPPVMPTSVPQDAQSVQQNFNYWPNPLWPESQSPSDEQRSTSHADARPPWNPSMEYQGRKPPVGQSDPAASNISGAAGLHQHHATGFEVSPVHPPSQDTGASSRTTSETFPVGSAQHHRHSEAQHALASPVRAGSLRQPGWQNTAEWETGSMSFSSNYAPGQYHAIPPASQPPQPLPLLQNENGGTRTVSDAYATGQTAKPVRYGDVESQGIAREQSVQESNLPFGTQGYEV